MGESSMRLANDAKAQAAGGITTAGKHLRDIMARLIGEGASIDSKLIKELAKHERDLTKINEHVMNLPDFEDDWQALVEAEEGK